MQNKQLISWLRFAAFFLFTGRGWQHFTYGGPYDTLYRSDNYLGLLTNWLTGDKNAVFAADVLSYINIAFGFLFMFAAVSVLFVNKKKNFYRTFVRIGWLLLFITAYGYYVDKFRISAQFFEYSAQLVIPFLLLRAVKFKMNRKFLFWAKLSIALTFVCHGLFAIGYYPVPGIFNNMLINTFGFTNETSFTVLKVVGILDFVFAIGIFVKPISKPILWYGLIWGFLTAFARVFSTIDFGFFEATFTQNTYEFLVRMPHFIVPLVLLKHRKDIII